MRLRVCVYARRPHQSIRSHPTTHTYPQELLFRHETEALAQRHPGVITTQFICTRDPTWTGRTARVDPALLWSLVPADGA